MYLTVLLTIKGARCSQGHDRQWMVTFFYRDAFAFVLGRASVKRNESEFYEIHTINFYNGFDT